MDQNTKDQSRVFEALGNEVRLSIVLMVAREKSLSCGDILKKFRLAQPTMSHHLNKLVLAGVLSASKEGVRHRYTVNVARLRVLGLNLKNMNNSITINKKGEER